MNALWYAADPKAQTEEVVQFRREFNWTCSVCYRAFQNCNAFVTHSLRSKAHKSALGVKLKAKVNSMSGTSVLLFLCLCSFCFFSCAITGLKCMLAMI